MASSKYRIVAAIDFGTTFSGYAYSKNSSPDDIWVSKDWERNPGGATTKAPSSVLVDASGNFVAFGYHAEERYMEMVTSKQQEGHQLFRHFKMMLHKEKDISRSTNILSAAGKWRNAMEIFVMVLRYLKDHFLRTVNMHEAKSRTVQDVKWVITVPAIWSDEAKDFMRESAFKAGLMEFQDSDQLLIALEPEAASVFCRSLDIKEYPVGQNSGSSGFKAGEKYLVIDAGGGTVDITVHEVLWDGRVKELHAANGDAWGGIKVDENFTNLLKEVLGKNFIEHYESQCPQQWLKLMKDFDAAKKVKVGTSMNIPLNFDLGTEYQNMIGGDIRKVINKSSNIGVSFSNGFIVFSSDAVRRLMQPVTSQIVQHISELMKIPSVRQCSYFLLVGGFGECAYLQEAIIDKFGRQVTVMVPPEAQLCVIKGAVKFGQRPADISTRIAKKTYGVEIMKTFDSKIHDRKYFKVVDGVDKCDGLFDAFVQKGDAVNTEEKISRVYYNPEAMSTSLDVTIFAINRKTSPSNPEYTDTDGFQKLGQITVSMPNTTDGTKRKVDVDFMFGGTEIKVTGTDRTTGKAASTKVSFLSH